MVPHPVIPVQALPDGRAQHRQQGQGGNEDQIGRPHRPLHLPADGLLLSQGGILGELGGEHQPQGAEKGRGQQEHGQRHAKGHAVGRHRLPLVHSPLDQQPGDEHRVGRGDEIPQQGRKPQGQGDPPNLAPEGLGGQFLPGQTHRRPQVHPEEHRLGEGGDHLAQGHAQHNGPHGLLGGVGRQAPQQGQHQQGPEDLLRQLRDGGGVDPARAVKIVLLEIFRPRQQQTGDQEDESQLGSCVPQKIHRGPVRKEQQQGTGHQGQQEKQLHRLPPDLVNGPLVPQGLVPGGEIGHRRGQPHRGQGQQHRIHRQDQLIQPQNLRPRQTGQPNPIHKPHQLGQHPRDGQHRHTAHPLTSCSSHCMRGRRETMPKNRPPYDGRAEVCTMLSTFAAARAPQSDSER